MPFLARLAAAAKALVPKKLLGPEVAPPGKEGARRWSHPGVATGLTPRKLAAIFTAADGGDLAELLTLATEIERRDSHQRAQLVTRKLAVLGLEWVVEAATDDARDVAIAAELQAIVSLDIWNKLIAGLSDAYLKPFAACEIMWEVGPRWMPIDFIWRDPRSFALSAEDGNTLRVRTEGQPKEGEELPPAKFIVHTAAEISGPLATAGLVRPLAVLYVLKTQGVRAWLTFCELYGIPTRLGTYPPNTNEDDIEKLWEALISLGEDGAGLHADTMEIKLLEPVGKGGGATHQGLADWCDSQASKVIVGQTMTADDGASLSQAKVHNDVRRDYIVADARSIAATIRRDFVIPWCKINFGELAAYPKVRAVTDEPEDRKTFVDSLVPLIDRGFEVEASVVADRLGLPVPAKGAKILRPLRGPAEAGDAGDASEPEKPPSKPAKATTKLDRITLLRELLAHLTEETGDFIDDESSPDDWKTTMAPLLDAVADEAGRADGFDDFLSRLAGRRVDATMLAESLALRTLQARGRGDATDEVKP